ncbi:MAG: Modification methylase VspI [Candidatus Heimdallarchaeota archaeon LC_3]|nr:MAG: Modification methylase VspI [Candidatus Heimdallarchaeota archaeon LC_3]
MTKIPVNIDELANLLQEKQYKVNLSPIETSYILEEKIFQNKKHLAEQVEKIWHLIDKGDFFHIWVVQSEKWYLKSWKKQVTRVFQLREFADQLIFFVPKGEDKEWENYSLAVITQDGVDYVDIISSTNPTMEVVRFWEKLTSLNYSLSDYEPISIAQQTAHTLTAENLIKSLDINIEEVLGVFQEAGLTIYNERFVLPREEAPLYNLGVLDVQLEEKSPFDFVKKNLNDYKNLEVEKLLTITIIMVLTKNELVFADKKGNLLGIRFIKENEEYKLIDSFNLKTQNKKSILDIFSSLIACIDTRTIFNAETFAQQYGSWSVLGIWAQNILLKYLNNNFESIKILYLEWEKRFGEVYKKNDTTIELFIKHSYLAYLVKLVLLEQYREKLESENPSFNDLLNYLNEKEISVFAHDFFHWAENIAELHSILLNTIKDADFDSADIFRVIYQQMVSPSTRHALGEFYTPPKLAELMIDKSYELNQKVLDPACGSGTFLVEIIKNIKRRGISLKDQIIAIENIYGFDINPVAIAVSKANVLLQLNTISDDPVPVNIYLTNSLFPVEYKKLKLNRFQKSLDTGRFLIFPMDSINQTIEIPDIFYSSEFSSKFADLLRKLDLLLIDQGISEIEFLKELNTELNISDYNWLTMETGPAKSSLKEIFIDKIAKKIFKLCKNDQNHIWSYLLFNSIAIVQTRNKMDLIIGNPPWLVLNGIYSKQYKEKVKILAEKLEIKPSSYNVTHLEMSALFLYQANEIFLKEGGSVAFVVSNAFMMGSQHNGTRKFKNFSDIKFWKFSKDVFNIHNICIFTKKSSGSLEEEKYNPLVSIWQVNEEIKEYQFELIKQEKYVPISILRDENGNIKGIEKFISPDEREKLLPRTPGVKNFYFSKCYQGASLVPRPFIYVNIKTESKEEVIIEPYMDFQSKKPWDFRPFNEAKVEKDYIHKVVKSTELVPFLILESFSVFLPINTKENFIFKGDPDDLKPKAKAHFKYLKDLYIKKQKEGASIEDIWERWNFQKNLDSKRQKSKFKVVTPQAGGFVKAALIKDSETYVDYKLYLLPVKDEKEGYFLVSIMNSPCISEDVKVRSTEGAGGGVRNLMKRPWEINIPKFSFNNPLHIKIAEIGEDLENKVIEISQKWKKEQESKLKVKEEFKWRQQIVQNLILKQLEPDLKMLDDLVLKLFN